MMKITKKNQANRQQQPMPIKRQNRTPGRKTKTI